MRGGLIVLRLMVLSLLVALLNSCEHRLLTDPAETHYVRVYLDEQIKNITCGIYDPAYEVPEWEAPVNLRAVLADPQTGEVVSERILRGSGKDERGKYIDGYIAAPSGTYDFLVYEVGTFVTKIANPYVFHDMYAYTNPIYDEAYRFIPAAASRAEPECRIVQQPDHLFREVCRQVVVSDTGQIDTLYNSVGEHFEASSMVLSYFLKVNIAGVEWVTSAAALMNGMAGSSMMGEKGAVVESDPVDLFFKTQQADRKRRSGLSSAVLYSTFNTFGKIPGGSTTLRIELMKTDGSSQVEEFDLTEMFDTPMVKDNQWIILEREIVATKPEGTGGMKPGVEGWNEIDADVPM